MTARGARTHLLVLLGYLGLGLAYCARLLADPAHRTLAGGRGDASLFLWFLSHTATALRHGQGHGLLVTHALNAPYGVNAMWNTSLLLPGALLSPVTLVAGPVLTLNLVLLLGPVLSAWSAYLCAGRFLTRTPARVVAGLVFGFSPALMATTKGHLHLTLLPLVPPLLLLALDAATGHRSAVRSGLLLGLLAACQVLVGEEVLALAAVSAGALLLVVAAQRRAAVRARLLPLALALAVAATTALALVGYPLWVQFFGPQRVHGEIQVPDRFVLDPAQLVTPTAGVWLRQLRHLPVTRLNEGESMGYVGLPLLVLLAALLWVRRRDLVTRTAGVSALVLAVLALGYTLHLAGRSTGLPVPWKLSDGLPVVGSLLPVRWMLVVFLLLGLLVGLVVERLPAGGRPRLVGALLVALCLLPLVPRPLGDVAAVDAPAYFTHRATALRGTALVVPVPSPGNPQAMTWHALSGARFAMPGGYFVGPHQDGRAAFGTYPRRDTERVLLQIAFSGSTVLATPLVRRHAEADLAFWGARTVVLGPSRHEDQLLAFLTDLLGRPERTEGVWVWHDARA